jgi:hypothetical protein
MFVLDQSLQRRHTLLLLSWDGKLLCLSLLVGNTIVHIGHK